MNQKEEGCPQQPGGLYSSFILHPSEGSSARSQKLLDRPQDGLAVGDAATDDVLLVAQRFVDVLVELAGAIRTLHLPVAEQVDPRQQLLLQDLQAVRDV